MARVQQPSAVAVVGTGSIGRRHLANFRELGCRVIGVSEHRRTTSIDLDGGPIPCMPSLAHALAQGVDQHRLLLADLFLEQRKQDHGGCAGIFQALDARHAPRQRRGRRYDGMLEFHPHVTSC